MITAEAGCKYLALHALVTAGGVVQACQLQMEELEPTSEATPGRLPDRMSDCAGRNLAGGGPDRIAVW